MNSKLWSELIDFLTIYKSTNTYQNTQIPQNSKTLFKDKEKILFENKNDNLKYNKTAFSKFNFNFYYNSNIYTTKEEKPNKKQIYLDSLDIANSQRQYLLCAI